MAKKVVYAVVLAAQESKLQEFTAELQSECAGRTALRLLNIWIEMEEMSSVCAA